MVCNTELMKTTLNEKDIKAAVIEKVRARVAKEDAVLINEMVIGDGDRRADLVIANGHMNAFEVKSDLDNLSRLSGQLESYLSRFDKLTLVVSSKYIDEALKTEERIGVWEAFVKNGAVKIRVHRPGRLELVSDRENICGFMLKSELVSFLRSHDVVMNFKDAGRGELISRLERFPMSTIRKAAIGFVTARYRSLSSTFLDGCSSVVAPADLINLSRSKVNRLRLEEELGWNQMRAPSSKRREINLSKFFPEGDIPDSMPRYILVPSV